MLLDFGGDIDAICINEFSTTRDNLLTPDLPVHRKLLEDDSRNAMICMDYAAEDGVSSIHTGGDSSDIGRSDITDIDAIA
jgi:hypothetical protein